MFDVAESFVKLLKTLAAEKNILFQTWFRVKIKH